MVSAVGVVAVVGEGRPIAEELARDQVYKVRWAHEGKLLDMRLPKKYLRVLQKLNEEEHWAGGAQIVCGCNGLPG